MKFCFWLLAITIFYVYFGYPLSLLIIRKIRSVPILQKDNLTPSISMIIPAYNEEKSIGQKIKNSLCLDYPKDKLEIIIVSDGSTDGTNEIVKKFNNENVKLITFETNQGKSAAENAAMKIATGEIFVFSDATGLYNQNALKDLVRPFADSSVGCVVGLVKYENDNTSSVSGGEGLYWKYETFLRRLESEVGNLAMASGSIMACRRFFVETLDEAVGEDFVIPMKAAKKGYLTVFEPSAISMESMVEKSRDLLRTKIRIITKDLRGLFLCKSILNFFRYPLYAWALISHKLLRWLVPYFLIALFAINLFLLNSIFYFFALILQLSFYAMALIGYLVRRKIMTLWILSGPFSFCLVNAAALIGFAKFLIGKKAGRWVPVRK